MMLSYLEIDKVSRNLLSFGLPTGESQVALTTKELFGPSLLQVERILDVHRWIGKHGPLHFRENDV